MELTALTGKCRRECLRCQEFRSRAVGNGCTSGFIIELMTIQNIDELVDKAMQTLQDGEHLLLDVIGAMGLDPDALSLVEVAQITMSLDRYRTDVYHSEKFPLIPLERKPKDSA